LPSPPPLPPISPPSLLSFLLRPARAPVSLTPCRAAASGPSEPSSSSAPSSSSTSSSGDAYSDPQAQFHRYGKQFGGGYRLSSQWLRDVPQVRVRRTTDRQRDQLADLAVLNAALAGEAPYETRKRLEYIKMRRRNWEEIFERVTRHETAATLSSIEECNRRVEEALSEEARETRSLGDLNIQLQVCLVVYSCLFPSQNTKRMCYVKAVLRLRK
jgi:hypothetical protein